MKAKKLIICCAIVVSFLLVPYAHALDEGETDQASIEKYSPKLEIEYVIQRAKTYAAQEVTNLKDYYVERVEYEYKDKSWWVHYMGKIPAPGNFFDVIINDQTEKMRLMPGE